MEKLPYETYRQFKKREKNYNIGGLAGAFGIGMLLVFFLFALAF